MTVLFLLCCKIIGVIKTFLLACWNYRKSIHVVTTFSEDSAPLECVNNRVMLCYNVFYKSVSLLLRLCTDNFMKGWFLPVLYVPEVWREVVSYFKTRTIGYNIIIMNKRRHSSIQRCPKAQGAIMESTTPYPILRAVQSIH